LLIRLLAKWVENTEKYAKLKPGIFQRLNKGANRKRTMLKAIRDMTIVHNILKTF